MQLLPAPIYLFRNGDVSLWLLAGREAGSAIILSKNLLPVFDLLWPEESELHNVTDMADISVYFLEVWGQILESNIRAFDIR